MDNNIRALLNELYADDPALRAREAELVSLITALRSTKPTQPIDAKFKEQLRAALLVKATAPRPTTSWSRMLMWVAPVAAVAVVAVIAVQNIPPNSSPIQPGGGLVVTNAAREAFGELSYSAADAAATRSQAGGGVETTPDDRMTILPAPDYRVTVFSAPESWAIPQLPVLQRSMNLGRGLTNLVNGLELDLVSLAAMKNVQLDYLTLSEQAEDGYSITVDRLSGQINLSKKYSGDMAVKEIAQGSTLPADDVIIAAANSFLKKYGIATNDLAAPEIRKDWLAYQVAETRIYTPNQVTVIYPWIINGVPVVDESGWAYGLNVAVNVGDMTISSVNNIVPLRFSSSDYETVTNRDDLLPLIQRGGNSYVGGIPAPEVVTVALEQPTPVYLVFRSYRETTPVEYLAPALKFPVPAESIATAGRIAVVVPVVKDLLETGTDAGSVSTPANPAVDLPVTE